MVASCKATFQRGKTERRRPASWAFQTNKPNVSVKTLDITEAYHKKKRTIHMLWCIRHLVLFPCLLFSAVMLFTHSCSMLGWDLRVWTSE